MKFKKFKFKKVKSTNNTAIRIIKNSNFKYGMVISDTQLNGKRSIWKKMDFYKGNLFVSFFYELKNIKAIFINLTKINCLLVKKTLKNIIKKILYLKNQMIY
jgi:BirA family biotin operon repressor/biotin-[acetyl-CoA-carboxylase] ligase